MATTGTAVKPARLSLRQRWARFARGWPTALARQWPVLLVLACFAAGIVLTFLMHWRRGSVMMGGATGLGGLLRLVLPEDRAGLLVLRGRLWDAAAMGLAGAAMIVLAMVVPPL